MAHFFTDTQIHGHPLKSLLLCLLLFYGLVSFGQGNSKEEKYYEKAALKVKQRDFNEAINLLIKAVEKNPQFSKAFLSLGSIHNRLGMVDKGYSYLKNYIEVTPKPNHNVLIQVASKAFDLGEYDFAEHLYTRWDSLQLEATLDSKYLSKSIEFVKSQNLKKELLIEPLPKTVNQFKMQYLPAMTVDGGELFYTKLSKDNEDIMVSHFDGQWSQGESISDKINTPLNEGACTIAADGNTMIFTSCNRSGGIGSCDLYISRRTNGHWSKPKNIGAPVNSRYWESQPSLSADGRKLYFASNRPGGMGNRDLWVATYKNGEWQRPVNLGKPLNTSDDETTPFIHPNGTSLFFSSLGHPGMGGFDIFHFDLSDSASIPENLGYPINTFKDEVSLLISSDGTKGYFSKEEAKDQVITKSSIVSFDFLNSTEINRAFYLIGQIKDAYSNKPLKAEVQIVSTRKSDTVYQISSNVITGQFLAVLPANDTLGLYVNKSGYLFHDIQIIASENDFNQPDSLVILLNKIEVGKNVKLSNIYFETNSYILNPKSKSDIKQVVNLLNLNQSMAIEIQGHTDNVGSEEYNLELSTKRALAVLNAIIEKGIDKSRIEFKGYGSKRPAKPNKTEVGRSINRRIEFCILRQ